MSAVLLAVRSVWFILPFILVSCATKPAQIQKTIPQQSCQAAKITETGTSEKEVIVLHSKPGERSGYYTAPGKGEAFPGVSQKRPFTKNRDLFFVAPERVKPFVMRLWIAPWRDEKDRLRWSRTVYVDLPVNKWNIGAKPAISDKKLLDILSVRSKGTPTSVRRTTKHIRR